MPMLPTRREFLQLSGRGLGVLALSQALPSFAQSLVSIGGSETARRILVLIQLNGGNDGLNTLIPFEDAGYYRLRPTLAVAKSQVLPLTDALGLHPACAPFQRLLQNGELSVVLNVGHPQPSKSHLRASELWQGASATDGRTTGWLGRYLDLVSAETPDTGLPLAVYHTGAPPVALASNAETHTVGLRSDLRLQAAARANRSGASYPLTPFAATLRDTAALIADKNPARLHFLSLDGFDTHANQAIAHQRQLAVLAEGLHAFQQDLKARGLYRQVLTVVYSEFGRHPAENENRGTAHGTAGPVFLLGSRLRTPVLGTAPSLDLPAGADLVCSTDFRQVHAAVLEDWLGCPAEPVLGGNYPKLELF